jgi:predicted enzyme related to lactoylglutathione lyase
VADAEDTRASSPHRGIAASRRRGVSPFDARSMRMTPSKHATHGDFVWYEHLTGDPKAAIGFYESVVGWKTQPFDANPDYVMWVGPQGPVGGVMKLPADAMSAGARPHWMGDVMVDDVDAATKLARELGGTVLHEPSDIPTVGRFSAVADPQGAFVSLFSPSRAMDLHDLGKVGEFRWAELYTTDVHAAFGFYAKLFGWELVRDMDMGAMGVYRIFGKGARQLGGMMRARESSMPPLWNYYVGTDDLDAAIAHATKAGGKLLNGPHEVPGGARVAQLLDPQGAMFALHHGPMS